MITSRMATAVPSGRFALATNLYELDIRSLLKNKRPAPLFGERAVVVRYASRPLRPFPAGKPIEVVAKCKTVPDNHNDSSHSGRKLVPLSSLPTELECLIPSSILMP